MTFITHCNDFCHVLFFTMNILLQHVIMCKRNSSVIILSGGKSERMRFPKAYLYIDGRTFLEKIVDEYFDAEIDEIIVVMNEEFCVGNWKQIFDKLSSKIEIIKNKNPEQGRFHSLKLGLKKVGNNFCFIQNIDNPFVNKNVILSLWNNRIENGYTSPIYKDKGGHPILISKNVIQQLNDMEDEDLNLKIILKSFNKMEVAMDDETVLMNINTPKEYHTFIQGEINV